MTPISSLKPFFNPKLSDFIREELECRNWSISHFANVIGFSMQQTEDLLNDKTFVDESIAAVISQAFGQRAQFWLNLSSLILNQRAF